VFVNDAQQLPHTVGDLLVSDPVVDVRDVIQKTSIPYVYLMPSNLSLRDLDARLADDDNAPFYLAEAFQVMRNEYEYIFVDCPPNLGRATRMALTAADQVLIPIECQAWAFAGCQQIMGAIAQTQKRANPALEIMGLVINKYTASRSLEQGYNEALRKQYGEKVFRTEFHDNVQYTAASSNRLPITHYLPRSPQAQAYREFIKEFLHYG
jgi:chromosome partitioning protein